MIQLLAFVQSLERDFISRAKGISVSYGSSNKLWEDVVTALGMPKPRKRKFIANDGRAPDTTDELLSAEKTIKKKRNGPGRPLGSQNFNRNPLTTYQSYSAGTTKGHFNRCCCFFFIHSTHIKKPKMSKNVQGSCLYYKYICVYDKLVRLRGLCSSLNFFF